ncbi:MAG: AAA family ATPase, partial [Victivallales bacterium]|nr:AAA family ATPase [Victivallales bacterium]
HTMLDLIGMLQYPVIMVCTTGLGAINDAMLSIMALHGIGASIAGIVYNGMPTAPDPIAVDNVRTIARLSKLPTLAVIHRLPAPVTPEALAEAFAEFAWKPLLPQA